MPRTARTIAADICYHVLNRGNGRSWVFHDDDDFREFLTLSRRAVIDAEVDILAYCLMPNHYHFVMRPGDDIPSGQRPPFTASTPTAAVRIQPRTTLGFAQQRGYPSLYAPLLLLA